jgi:hypothetical protein
MAERPSMPGLHDYMPWPEDEQETNPLPPRGEGHECLGPSNPWHLRQPWHVPWPELRICFD